jgi:hypothetical protein
LKECKTKEYAKTETATIEGTRERGKSRKRWRVELKAI